MSGVDITLCILILVGCYSGYKEGFLMELFSLLAIILGVLGGFKLMGYAMIILGDRFNVDEKVLPYVAFGVVFVLIVITVRLLGNMLKMSADKSFLGKIDRIAGALLGFLKTTFMLSVVLWIVDSLKLNLPEGWVDNSWLLPKVANFAPALTEKIGEIFPFFKDVF